jgi:hypothetical protein
MQQMKTDFNISFYSFAINPQAQEKQMRLKKDSPKSVD